MSVIALALLTALTAASPRSSAALARKQAQNTPMGVAIDLTTSLNSRPERSQGGADLLLQLGLRGAYLKSMQGQRGLTFGGELALRSFLPETDGSSVVGSEIYRLSTQLGGLLGYRWAGRTVSLLPHASLGLNNGFALVHLKSPGNETWRPRWLPGLYAGAGVIGSFYMVMLRLDAALSLVDGRPEYRFDTGLGVTF